jgi:DNA modification methylase
MEENFFEINDGITNQKIYFQDCIEGMKQRIENESIDLIITSPPYWNLKDYGNKNQIGFGQSMEQYREKIREVFRECFRVLKEARRMIVNIRDKTVPSGEIADPKLRGNFEMIPLHAYLIEDAISENFKYLGAILWEKIGGGAAQHTSALNFIGSYPYPPSAHVSSKIEYVLIFRKKTNPESKPISRSQDIREQSKISKKTWEEYTSQIWSFAGDHVDGHPAAYPIEIPKRCITLWSFIGDLILDPFAGTGTTSRAAKDLKRNSIGFEINPEFKTIIKKRIGQFSNLQRFMK